VLLAQAGIDAKEREAAGKLQKLILEELQEHPGDRECHCLTKPADSNKYRTRARRDNTPDRFFAALFLMPVIFPSPSTQALQRALRTQDLGPKEVCHCQNGQKPGHHPGVR
jgi:hypothetical protein